MLLVIIPFRPQSEFPYDALLNSMAKLQKIFLYRKRFIQNSINFCLFLLHLSYTVYKVSRAIYLVILVSFNFDQVVNFVQFFRNTLNFCQK